MLPAKSTERVADDVLIAALANGEVWAANALYDQLYPAVDGALCRILGRRDGDYDDLVQSTFEQIVLSVANSQFEGKCSLKTWASIIASRVGIDAIRARRSRRAVFEEQSERGSSLPETPVSPERRLEARIEFPKVQQALAVIDPMQARIIVLHQVLGYSLDDIAEITGLSSQACQSRMTRGRKSFMRAIRKLDQGGSV